MSEHVGHVNLSVDHLSRTAKARTHVAIAELVWNAFDADATHVDIHVVDGDLGAHTVIVSDNGKAFPFEDIEKCFGNLGASWKRTVRQTADKRVMHGKEGRGRFRSLSIGRVCEWRVTFKGGNGYSSFTITVRADDPRDYRYTDPVKVDGSSHTGVEVRITEIHDDAELAAGGMKSELLQIFAPYLADYKPKVLLNGEALDPGVLIRKIEHYELSPIVAGDTQYPAKLRLVEWKTEPIRALFLCDENGFPFVKTDTRFREAQAGLFSAYLHSTYIGNLAAQDAVALAEMDPAVETAKAEARATIERHFSAQQHHRVVRLVEQWKEQRVYPYQGEPRTKVETVERRVFDLVAVNVNDNLPGFQDTSAKQKRFTLRVLRQAIEHSPEELQKVLFEVLELPSARVKELADLLDRTTLSSVISAARLIADRLDFLDGLDQLLFCRDLKKHFKERSQLQRLLVNHTWVFGEQFALTAEDKSLTTVLREHAKLLGEPVDIDDAPVRRADGSAGIVDLMLSRQLKHTRFEEREHLVVELKRPTVTLGATQVQQIQSYANAVRNDPRFRTTKVRWHFWLIGNEMDADADSLAAQSNRPPGLVFESPNSAVWVKTWAQVLDDNRSRLAFLREKLEYEADHGTSLARIRAIYESLNLPAGVVLQEAAAAPVT